ncbi:MAG: hypothetical protein IJF39_04305 [Clostridia bacterium]|nr:hypothetical protein [Clostridia bacterium]
MKKLQTMIAPLFLAVELGLYIIILFFSHLFPRADFVGIVLACAFALCFFKPTFPNLLLNVGLVATVCADVFLVLLQPLTEWKQVAGVAFFSITQMAYFLYLLFTEERKSVRLVHLIVRGAAVLIAELVLCIVLKETVDLLSVLSLFYVANLAVNAAFAFAQGKKGILFGIGLTLFLCCDLFVGFSVAIGSYIQIAESSWLYQLIFSDFNFVWFFYLPSQTVLAIFTMLKHTANK